jgi:hypothetical protein
MKKYLQLIMLSLTIVFATNVVIANNGTTDPPNYVTIDAFNDIRVYPNPAIDYIMITENEAVSQVWIYNILGRRVKRYEVETDAKYDIKDLPRGMYIVRLVNRDSELVMTRRINKINP